jgi:hypothetical protein
MRVVRLLSLVQHLVHRGRQRRNLVPRRWHLHALVKSSPIDLSHLSAVVPSAENVEDADSGEHNSQHESEGQRRAGNAPHHCAASCAGVHDHRMARSSALSSCWRPPIVIIVTKGQLGRIEAATPAGSDQPGLGPHSTSRISRRPPAVGREAESGRSRAGTVNWARVVSCDGTLTSTALDHLDST